MAQIEIDQELADYLHANEALTGETPSIFIRSLLKKRATKSGSTQRSRSDNTDLAAFLRILKEIHERSPDRFTAVESVRGRTRIYFSKDPKEIESSGRKRHTDHLCPIEA